MYFEPVFSYAHRFKQLALVFETLDSVIHWIKIYPLDNVIGFPNTYRLDSDLSSG